MNRFKSYFKLARPDHYIKNGFIFLPLFFANRLDDTQAFVQTLWAFIIFCLAASTVYVFNDIRDIEADRSHPVKKSRPLASGALNLREAGLFLSMLLILSISASLILLGKVFSFILGGYLLLNLLYSLKLKH